MITEVLGTGAAEDPFRLVLDRTVFFPTGGGQLCDLGTIDGVPLTDVSERDGRIFHTLLSAPANHGEKPYPAGWTTGNEVRCVLDWERRFDHMQRHCGEHILSGIFFRECGGVNRGFHMGRDYMTIDIDVPGITREQAQRIETLTNEVIWENVPVTVRYFKERSEAEQLPLRKALAVDEDISVVCVGEESNPADCVACCGTHPSSSGQVGLVKIFKLENYKGMTRVYFDAGRNALADYQNKQRILAELNMKYSADDNDLLVKMRAQDEKNKEIRQELYLLKNHLISTSVNEILNHYGISAAVTSEQAAGLTSSGLVLRTYDNLNVNDLLAVARALTDKPAAAPKNSLTEGKPLIVLVSSRENIAILASAGEHDCGKIVRDNAAVWNGKGGGNTVSARVMFPSEESLNCFVTFIRQAYGSAKS